MKRRPPSWSTSGCGAGGGAVKFDLVGDRNPLSEFAQRGEASRAWCAERESFAREHGWTGGSEARLQEEGLAEPFDLSAL